MSTTVTTRKAGAPVEEKETVVINNHLGKMTLAFSILSLLNHISFDDSQSRMNKIRRGAIKKSTQYKWTSVHCLIT